MSERPFVLPLVPPNLTGDLHLGHALMASVQDAVVRSVRQDGRATVFVPGVDHAGIGMYAQVRSDAGFLPDRPMAERLTAWAAEHHRRIGAQFRSLLLACDWDLETYTLDPGYVDLVHWAFRELADRGLVYRGHRLVHWCPCCRTALSDMECETTEGPRSVAVVPVRLAGGTTLVEVPQPELLWAVTALAVPGGADAAGTATVPSPAGSEVPVVDGPGPAFVTAGADAVLDEDGRSIVAGAEGVDRDRLRRWTFEQLRLRGATRPVAVASCGRCGSELADRTSWQWFVRMGPLVAPVLAAVRSGEVRITPDAARRQAVDWLEKAEDWCVSRQIPWGQVVPARRCADPACAGFTTAADGPCPGCGGPTVPETDVFDTWFSSSLWPLGTAGWPDDAEVARRYPADLMTSGRDILFFYFLRVLALGRELTGRFPTAHCHLHGMVLDAHGRKMSKSRGNTVTVATAVGEHGADVVRTALLAACRDADDLRAAPELFARAALVRSAFAGLASLTGGDGGPGDALDHWCASAAAEATAARRAALADLRFSAAARAVDGFATGPLSRYVATVRRLGRAAHPAVAAAAATLAEPLMPGVAADLAAAAGPDGGGSGWAPDADRAGAAAAVLDAVAELERLRGSVGLPADRPVAVDPGGAGAPALGEPWVPASTRLTVVPGGPPDGVPWRLPDRPDATVWLPAEAAPRLRREAARRLRAAADRHRSLAARLALAEAGGPSSADAAARLGGELAAVTARREVLRQNAAAAAGAASPSASPSATGRSAG